MAKDNVLLWSLVEVLKALQEKLARYVDDDERAAFSYLIVGRLHNVVAHWDTVGERVKAELIAVLGVPEGVSLARVALKRVSIPREEIK